MKLCKELGLTGEAAPLIAHAIHEEIVKHKRDAIEWGVIGGESRDAAEDAGADKPRDKSGLSLMKDKTGLGLGWGRAPKDGRGPKSLRSVWRDWAEAEEFRTRFEVLTAEEVERRELEKERASRHVSARICASSVLTYPLSDDFGARRQNSSQRRGRDSSLDGDETVLPLARSEPMRVYTVLLPDYSRTLVLSGTGIVHVILLFLIQSIAFLSDSPCRALQKSASQSCDRRVKSDSHAPHASGSVPRRLGTLSPSTASLTHDSLHIDTDSNRMDPSLASKLARTRDQYKAQLATALTEDADPLAAYDAFVKWTVDNYGSHLAQSGLLELLEEATRHFVDDDAYKSDLRYLKLWLLYANHVEDPTVIYDFILFKNIGKIYAQTYWEYAGALDRNGR